VGQKNKLFPPVSQHSFWERHHPSFHCDLFAVAFWLDTLLALSVSCFGCFNFDATTGN
jgi:hypothetical protein